MLPTQYIVPVACMVDGALFGLLLGMSIRLLVCALFLHAIAVTLWSITDVVKIDITRLTNYLTMIGTLLSGGQYSMYVGALLVALCFIVGIVVGFIIGTKIRIYMIERYLMRMFTERGMGRQAKRVA